MVGFHWIELEVLAVMLSLLAGIIAFLVVATIVTARVWRRFTSRAGDANP